MPCRLSILVSGTDECRRGLQQQQRMKQNLDYIQLGTTLALAPLLHFGLRSSRGFAGGKNGNIFGTLVDSTYGGKYRGQRTSDCVTC